MRDHNHHLLIRNEKLHAFMVAATFNLTKQWIIAFEISHVCVCACVCVCRKWNWKKNKIKQMYIYLVGLFSIALLRACLCIECGCHSMVVRWMRAREKKSGNFLPCYIISYVHSKITGSPTNTMEPLYVRNSNDIFHKTMFQRKRMNKTKAWKTTKDFR